MRVYNEDEKCVTMTIKILIGLKFIAENAKEVMLYMMKYMMRYFVLIVGKCCV